LLDKHMNARNILKFLRYCMFMFSIWVFFVGNVSKTLNTVLIGTLLMYLTGMVYSIERFKRRIVLFFFYVTVFVFLLSRPTISMFRGAVWWYYGKDGCYFALRVIFLSLICVYLGAVLFDKILNDKGWFKNEGTAHYFNHLTLDTDYYQTLSFISGVGYYITFVFSVLQGIEKIVFVSNGEYADVYVSFRSSLPFIVNALGVLMPYFLCVYLACMPKKRQAVLALVFYVLSTVPALLVGARNNTVLALMLALVYFVIRDYLDGTSKWIGKFEKVCIIIALPLGLAFLGYYNYARDGIQAASNGIGDLIVDFFYKQGVSFDVMCIAHNVRDNMPDVVDKCYTFGGMIDHLRSNMIARELFGAVSLGEGNNEIKAIFGNSFAHSLAYVAEPNYLSGHGLGSSYILETYADFGAVGVGIFSFILSGFMTVAVPFFKRNMAVRIFVLNCMTLFFLIPRAEATGWLNFILYIQFWAVIIFCCIMAQVFKRDSTRISSLYYKKKRMIQDV